MQFKKIILTIVIGLFAYQPVFGMKQTQSKKPVSIQQVSEKRIAQNAKQISSSIWRNNILAKTLLIGGGTLAVYELYSMVKEGRKGNQLQGQHNLNERIEDLNRRLQRYEQQNPEQAQPGANNQVPAHENKTNFSWLKSSGKFMIGMAGMTVLQNVLSHIGNKIFNNVVGTSSINAFDQHSTHCDSLLEYIVHTIKEVAEFVHKTGQNVPLDKEDFAMTCNRLISRIENIIGYVRAKRINFKNELGIEAENLEKRLIEYTSELAEDLHDILEETDINYMELAQIVAKFGQRYGQEKQRFELIEQDAKA